MGKRVTGRPSARKAAKAYRLRRERRALKRPEGREGRRSWLGRLLGREP